MDGTYSELRDKAVSQDLKERLMMAVADVAVEVYSDPTETDQHKTYAVQVAKNPRSIAEQMTPLIVILAADDSDAKIKLAVHTVFNVYASQVEVI
jgi:hypothetical protein